MNDLEFNFDWFNDDYGVSIPDDAPQSPLINLALESLNKPEDDILRDWLKIVYPKILDYFSLKQAKGVSKNIAENLAREVKSDKQEKVINTLVNLKDQSLAIHLLNAALGGWTLVKLAHLDNEEKQIYLAGVTLHDLNKIVLDKLGDFRMDGDNWNTYKQELNQWGERLDLWEFISQKYWQDVAFLAQNAEDARGSNLTIANFPELQLTSGHLTNLAEFVRFGDLVASVGYHPDDLEQDNIKAIIRRLLRGKYIIRYHKTNENRGLLTQEIHNAVLEKTKKVGWIPFLYFPDGVTYFAPKDSDEPDLTNIAEIVRNNILKIVSKGVGNFISRAGKGVKYAPDLIEIADVKLACHTLIRRAFAIISDKKEPVTDARREKILSKNPQLKSLDWEYPNNLQCDRIAEGFNGITGLISDYFGLEKDAITKLILDSLNMAKYFEDYQKIPSDGGVPHGWYYIGGHYIKKNPSLNEAELEEIMLNSVNNILEKLGKPDRPPPFSFLDDYIAQVLNIHQNKINHNFAGELSRYHKNKANRKREAICAICNSNFEIREEFSNYSNKRVTSASKESKRGVCVICQVEKLLRRNVMETDLSAEDETVYLHLYPAYYFTPETNLIMNRAYDNFAQSNFAELDKEFSKEQYNPNYLPRLDIFRIGEDPNANKKRRVYKEQLSEEENQKHQEGKMHGYYLLGVPYLGKNPTNTETWTMPSILSLIAPIALGIKVIASRNPIPIYDSGADFKETVMLDGVHNYWQHSIKKTIFRLDELEKAIPAVFSVYALTSQAYRDSKNFPVWNALNGVSQSLDTSILYIFHYADRIEQNSKLEDMPLWLAEKLFQYHGILTEYYQTINPNYGGAKQLKMIQEIVDQYACFYRAKGRAAYARLRPFNTAAKVILDSLPSTSQENLKLIIEGELMALLDGIRDKHIDGYLPDDIFKNREKAEQLISIFADSFIEKIFNEYCQKERSLLRKNINLLRKGAEAYYIKTYGKKSELQEEN
ncbi:type I-D CRISPR-associated protein Cas10d/Csc3 [Cyanobacterium aponinum UTEX 3222]|uniref:type I-D CRISPR-associated protein Cas10d/Csc3 n=1 Tax=Cyanobacterium aponinum TaxID=379064 RepID=UPI002B4C04FE|nr:type I-D CRISPR-associated protein Cas10d/Csc3 [Cyanobacterium aponinum]WRL36948.1 type I-D CRISPR-associated protein Cas10d/Csc3 [Cyanobacterium aponinum UTEX 3221]WRL43280.1 type I-D CRISPR-associated protein Cas10d/Csc3 [Cyanobacterium aponinum UTEX 3222]